MMEQLKLHTQEIKIRAHSLASDKPYSCSGLNVQVRFAGLQFGYKKKKKYKNIITARRATALQHSRYTLRVKF